MTAPVESLPIIRADQSHVQAIVDLEQRSFSPADRFSRKTWRHLLGPANKKGTAITLVALQAGLVVGSVNVLLRTNGRNARIYSLAVDPAMRGRGVGGELIQALCDQVPKHYAEFTLEVRSDNVAARHLYERLSFTVDRPLPQYYLDGADGLRYRVLRSQLATLAKRHLS
jgi:ribosomal protein S18 acetylase RimI-like enzyme